MSKIISADMPIRITERDNIFYLFNTQFFEGITLDPLSMEIFNEIQAKKIEDVKGLEAFAKERDIYFEDCKKLLAFLDETHFIKVVK